MGRFYALTLPLGFLVYRSGKSWITRWIRNLMDSTGRQHVWNHVFSTSFFKVIHHFVINNQVSNAVLPVTRPGNVKTTIEYATTSPPEMFLKTGANIHRRQPRNTKQIKYYVILCIHFFFNSESAIQWMPYNRAWLHTQTGWRTCIVETNHIQKPYGDCSIFTGGRDFGLVSISLMGQYNQSFLCRCQDLFYITSIT